MPVRTRPLSGIGVGQDHVERADAVGRDQQQPVGTGVVEVADLAAGPQLARHAHRRRRPPRRGASRASRRRRRGCAGTAPGRRASSAPRRSRRRWTSGLDPRAARKSASRSHAVGGRLLHDRGRRRRATARRRRARAARTGRTRARRRPRGSRASGPGTRAGPRGRREHREHEVEQTARVGQDHALGRRVRDVALVPERHVLERRLRVRRAPRARARRCARSHRVALVRHGADEPFCPSANGSCTSRTSVRARWRISVANCVERRRRDARAPS